MSTTTKKIAKGTVSDIYRDDTHVYKQYQNSYPLQWIEYEANVQNIVHSHTSLPVSACEFLKDTRQILMPFIEGCTLGYRMQKLKYKDGLNDLISLQHSVHQFESLDLESAHDVFATRIQNATIDHDVKTKALDSLSHIEVKHNLCHFDFHFLNVMFDGEKYHIIDWVNAKIGNPILDIARTYIILKQYATRLSGKYLKQMIVSNSYDQGTIKDAIYVMATLRMLESDSKGFMPQLTQLMND